MSIDPDPDVTTKPVLGGEPALAIGVVVAVLLGALGVVIDASVVTNVLIAAAPLVSAILTRFKVSPVRKVEEGV